MFRDLVKFFDRLEDKVRGLLSRSPVIYAIIGGTAVVLFWRGVELVADSIPWLTGPVSLIISVIILLVTGIFVSFFIGDQIILSGIAREKKITEKTEEEVKSEAHVLDKIHRELHEIKKSIENLKNEKK